jgi:energy-coupling factor transporter transmembrane protein EcfT
MTAHDKRYDNIMIRRLTYFNLIYGIALFAQLGLPTGSSSMGNRVIVVGVIIVTWYNWESLKVIKGQKKRLGKLGLVLGILTSLFSSLLLMANVLRLLRSTQIEDMRWALELLSILEIIFAITVMIQVIWTTKKFFKDERTSPDSSQTA